MIRTIVEVKAMDDFTLECEMENGEVYRYDMSFINKENGEMIESLRDVKMFKGVWLDEIGGLGMAKWLRYVSMAIQWPEKVN